MIGETVKQYKILSEIGGGGMGLVYLAHDTDLDCKVALKFLPPELTRSDKAKTRFRLEAQSAAALQHPHICTIHAISETEDGRMYICMPYYEGRSLKEHIAAEQLPVREVYEIASCVADGLMAAHNNDPPIIHRDIKPANIMITKTGYVVVVDFGLAKLVGRTKVTMTGVTPGTASYMSPEQVQGKDLDGRTDIWSLGVVMYEALTGETPFGSDLEQALFYQIVNEAPKPVRELRADVPEEFAAVVDKCLAKSPEDRYASMQDLLTAMHEVAMKLQWQSSTTVRPVLPIRTWEAEKKQRRMRWVAGGIAIAMLVAFVVYKVLPPREPPSPFVTDVRLAVLPFENLAGTMVEDALVEGTSQWLAHVVDQASRHHESMWVLPYVRTGPGRIATPADVKDGFGVNRLLMGSVQKFGQNYRYSVELLDAETLEPLETADVDFQLDDIANAVNQLVDQTVAMFAIELDAAKRLNTGISNNPVAMQHWLESLGFLQRPSVTGNIQRSLDSAAAAFKLDADFLNAKATLAHAYWNQYRKTRDEVLRTRALDGASHAALLDTTNVFANTAHMDLAAFEKQHDDVILASRRIIAADPMNSHAHERAATALIASQRFDEAEAQFATMIQNYPDYYQGYRHLGHYYSVNARYDAAIAQYVKVLTLAPNHTWTLKAVGGIYVATQQLGEARKVLQRSFAIQPDCYTCGQIGSVLYQLGEFPDASRYYEFALSYCDSTDANFFIRWNDLGDALYWTDGRRDDARHMYRKALQLAQAQRIERPDDAVLLAYLGGLHAVLGDSIQGQRLAGRAAELADDNGAVMFTVGWTFEMLHQREKAIHHLSNAARYGFPIDRIEREPLLQDLTEDILYKQTIADLRLEASDGSASN